MNKKIAFLLSILLLATFSCKNRVVSQTEQDSSIKKTENTVATKSSSSHWFYFSENGIHSVSNPSEIPSTSFKPWTEAIRVSDVSIINSSPVLLINRLGIMTSGSPGYPPSLHKDSLFSGTTAAGLYRTEKGTAIRLYKNTFFSEKKAGNTNLTCLANYDPTSGTFSPFLSAKDFGLDDTNQCVALDRIGSRWYASFKGETNSKVDFTYLEFEDFPIPESEASASSRSDLRKISSETYQESVRPFPLSRAPEQLLELLSSIPESTSVNIKLYSRSTKSVQNFIRQGESTPVDAHAFVSEDRTAVLFSDGTFLYRPDNSSSNRMILKLPALSSGYVYTTFVLSGKTLLAAWEEQRFFETGRAGLLENPLPNEVY